MVSSSVFLLERILRGAGYVSITSTMAGDAVLDRTGYSSLRRLHPSLHRLDMFRGNRQAHGPVSKPQPVPSLTRSVICHYR